MNFVVYVQRTRVGDELSGCWSVMGIKILFDSSILCKITFIKKKKKKSHSAPLYTKKNALECRVQGGVFDIGGEGEGTAKPGSAQRDEARKPGGGL